ncbi:MAG: phenylalanine--tRNA ligase subunit beta [Proteobacteria bacterium]|nr:phenylalanine--tRNA ligase subunit beta [Pseudomonadota bacterium]NCA27896.1 phenylalanine--tRNA ligase subunit beta [Pseudomonadota bacterium]
MKITLSSLKEFLDTSATLDEICQTLTKIGLEVESVEDKSKALNYFSVAKIIDSKPHDNSQKLKICLVETIDSQTPLQIICGAPNAKTGIKVAYAPINSIIPSNLMQIKKAKIAGVESNGMLCSARELNLGNDDNGIIEIDEKFAIGTKISEVFGIDDATIEINITPNRGDCLGVYGIACDLSATGIGKLKALKTPKIPSEFEFNIKFENHAKNDCPFIAFRIIKNIKNQPSPKWLSDKLEAIGMNSISAVVDSLNYVMHLLNRPMHAYDLQKIGDKIQLKKTNHPTQITTLKNAQHLVDSNILTICNDDEIFSIAGVIGSEQSSCKIDTTEILLESAYFSKEAVARAGRSLNILSDSRHRFERGVDYGSCIDGIELASKLITDICGGKVSDIFIDEQPFNPTIIDFDFNKFQKLIGINLENSYAISILESLQFKVDKNLKVEVPTKRHDIFSSEDLIEEILRIYGYDKILKNDLKLPKKHIQANSNLPHKARILLASKGLTETISWSFVDEKNIDFFCQKNPNLVLKNPISQELSLMRPNLIIGLLNSYQKNYLRNISNLSLFEIGNVFENQNSQKLMIAGLRTGKNSEPNHFGENRDYDFFDVKKDFYDIVDLSGIKPESLTISSDSAPKYYHPHRSASVKIGKNIIGYIGEINPQINKIFDLKNRLYTFEIFLDSLPNNSKNLVRKPFIANDLPIVERDFAFLVDKNILVGDLLKSISAIDKNFIKDIVIFDIYRGEKIDSSQKSVAVKVKIQPIEKTLTSSEIDSISAKIIENLSVNFKAKIRDN